jgi:hypothetical protein
VPSWNFVARPSVETDDCWAVWVDVTQSIKERLDALDASIPFPQRGVHFSTRKVPDRSPDAKEAGPLRPRSL